MPATIIPQKVPLTTQDREELEKLFGSPGYSLLKRVLACHCILEQVASFNDGLYYENETARFKSEDHRSKAAKLNTLLDWLDDVEGRADEWFTLTLEPRR